MIGFARAVLLFLVSLCPAWAQAGAFNQSSTEWSYTASAYGYLIPEGVDYVQPTFTADRRRLHLEGRYNYEELHTGSAWAGYNFSWGKKVTFDLTPMLGGVFGRVNGVAPGYKGSLGLWRLELYSEGERVFASKTEDSFFYNWSELTLRLTNWLRAGGVTQRTRAYQTDREIQRGFLVGVSYRGLELRGHIFNPDEIRPVVVLSANFSF